MDDEIDQCGNGEQYQVDERLAQGSIEPSFGSLSCSARKHDVQAGRDLKKTDSPLRHYVLANYSRAEAVLIEKAVPRFEMRAVAQNDHPVEAKRGSALPLSSRISAPLFL